MAGIPSSVRVTSIMAKPILNMVSTIKVPSGQCTHRKAESLKEVFRVHFPDSELIDYLKTCLRHGYISITWRKVKSTLAPKPEKSDTTEVKVYHPFS
jgi:hypothetical protein